MAQAPFIAPVAEVQLLNQKQRLVGGQGRGHVGLFAEGREVAPSCLPAKYATPAADGFMGEFEAPFTALVLETRTHLAAFHFPVAIIGMGHPQPHPVKAGERLLIFPAQVPPLLAHIDMGRAVVVMIMVMPVIVPTAMPLWSMGMT